jgi:hypothetical protein
MLRHKDFHTPRIYRLFFNSVADPHPLNADTDPTFNCDADLTYHFDVVLITSMRIRILPFNLMRIDADPDPQHYFFNKRCVVDVSRENIPWE